MHLVAINTTDPICGVDATHPMACALVLRVAAQADCIRLARRPLFKGDDLRDITASSNVETSIAVALFACDSLLRMKSVLEVLRLVRVTRRAGVGADRRCSWDLCMLHHGRAARAMRGWNWKTNKYDQKSCRED